MRQVVVAFFLISTLFGRVSAAGASGSLAVTDPTQTPDVVDTSLSGATYVSGSLSWGNYTAFVDGSIADGTLRASTVSRNLTGGVLAYSTASVSIFDGFTFSGGSSGTAFLNYRFDGEFLDNTGSANGGRRSYANVFIDLTPNSGSTAPLALQQAFTNGPICPVAIYQNCSRNRDIVSFSGSLTVPILPSGYRFNAGILTSGWFGDTVDFSHTLTMELVLPPGVSIVSDSGVLFTGSVPENPTSWLAVAGLLGLLPFVRRRQLVG